MSKHSEPPVSRAGVRAGAQLATASVATVALAVILTDAGCTGLAVLVLFGGIPTAAFVGAWRCSA